MLRIARSTRSSSLALALSLVLVATTGPMADAPVADAAMRGDLEAVTDLLRRGADVNGMTALHWASERGDLEIVEALLFAGAFPDAATRNGEYSPLHLAAKAGHGQIVRTLLEGGANPGLASTTGTTALMSKSSRVRLAPGRAKPSLRASR